jgi:hypothetical protein
LARPTWSGTSPRARGPRRVPAVDRGKKGAKTRRGRLYTFTPEKFTFPEYYLNRAGTYYWQAYRIFCIRIPGRKAFDCIQEGPIRKFQVQ